MCKVNDRVGWAPPSYLKKVDKGDSTEGESDSDDDYLGLPGGESALHQSRGELHVHTQSGFQFINSNFACGSF